MSNNTTDPQQEITDQNTPTKKDKKTKKEKRKPRISNRPLKTVLFLTDERLLREKLKENIFDPQGKRFTLSSIIRKYVRLGLHNEKQTQHAEYALRDKIVRKSLFRMMDEFMEPHTKKMDAAMDKSDDILKKIDLSIENTNSQTRIIQKEIGDFTAKIFGAIDHQHNTSLEPEILRNLLTMRSVAYVFMLGFREAAQGAAVTNEKLWIKIVRAAHQKSIEMPVEELALLTEDNLETRLQKMAHDIYQEAYRQYQTQN